MAKVTISRHWPDGDVVAVSVKAENSYPDSLAEAKRIAVDAWLEAIGAAVEDDA